ncbi:hypothetical protein JHK86_000427 [Glycine max]|nr:hypothetical protein JHK86_000427 [Glycine max]
MDRVHKFHLLVQWFYIWFNENHASIEYILKLNNNGNKFGRHIYKTVFDYVNSLFNAYPCEYPNQKQLELLWLEHLTPTRLIQLKQSHPQDYRRASSKNQIHLRSVPSSLFTSDNFNILNDTGESKEVRNILVRGFWRDTRNLNSVLTRIPSVSETTSFPADFKSTGNSASNLRAVLKSKILFVFMLLDDEKKKQLDWKLRLRIIHGIARGILYLHEDSRLRVIHRDLKPRNVCLDDEMNDKISDFGLQGHLK